MIYSPNGLVAVEPINQPAVTAVEKNGFATGAHATKLVRLKVIFGNRNPLVAPGAHPPSSVAVFEGFYVYVKPDAAAHGKVVHEIAGKKFVLIPEQLVQLVETDVA